MIQESPPQLKSGVDGLSVIDANHVDKIPSQPSLDVGLGEPLRPWSGPVDPGTVTGKRGQKLINFFKKAFLKE